MSAIHVCVDVERDMASLQVIRAVSKLIKGLEARGIPTIYVAYGTPELNPHFLNVTQLRDVPKGLNRWVRQEILLPLKPTSLVAIKMHQSAYHNLSGVLNPEHHSPIIISGVCENLCVSTTARDFQKNRYDVVIAADATDLGVMLNSRFSARRDFFMKEGIRCEVTKTIFQEVDDNPFRGRLGHRTAQPVPSF